MECVERLLCSCGRSIEYSSRLRSTSILCPACTRPYFVSGPNAETTPINAAGRKRLTQEKIVKDWEPGDVHLDTYEVLGEVGAGGMGKVYRVRHHGWDIDLAVKCPSTDLLAQFGGAEQFEEECGTWVNLGLHPNVATCYYVRWIDGVPRIFCDYVDGGDLAAWIRDGRLYEGGATRALDRMLTVAIETAWGLDYSHRQGVVHRDVKPSNVLLTQDGHAKVTDFGLAKSLSADPESLEGSDRSFSGLTPAYCAPEQLEQGEPTPRVDIWSFAVTLLQMFTVEITWRSGLFAPDALEDRLRRQKDAGSGVPVPDPVVDLLRQCFEEDPEDRPADMEAVADALKEAYQSVLDKEFILQAPSQVSAGAENLNNRAVSLWDLGKRDEAIAIWKEALELLPNHPESSFNLLLQRWRMAEVTDEEVVIQIERLRSQQAEAIDTSSLIAEVHLERGDCVAAAHTIAEHGRSHALSTSIDEYAEVSRCELIHWEAHSDAVNAICLSLDKGWALSASADNSIRQWDIKTGNELALLQGHMTEVVQLRLSASGGRCLSSSKNGTVRVWTIEDGESEQKIRTGWARIHDLALPGDETTLWVLTDNNHAHRFDTETWSEMELVAGPKKRVTRAALSPDARLAAFADDAFKIFVWETESGQVSHSYRAHASDVTAMTFCPRGRILACGDCDGRISLVQLDDDSPHRILLGHRDMVTDLKLTEDGAYLVSMGEDHTMRLWDVAAGRCLWTSGSAVVSPSAGAISGDGSLCVTGDRSGGLAIWRLSPSTSFYAAPLRLSRHRDIETTTEIECKYAITVQQAREAVNNNGRLAALSALRTARAYPGCSRRSAVMGEWFNLYGLFEKHGLRDYWETHAQQVTPKRSNTVAMARDNLSAAVAGDDGEIHVLNLGNGTTRCRLSGHIGPVHELRMSHDGKQLFSAGEDVTVRRWDLQSGKQSAVFSECVSPVISIALSPDSRFLAALDWYVRFIDADSGKMLETLEVSGGQCNRLEWTPDGQYLLLMGGEVLRFWNVSTGEVAATLNHRPYVLNRVALSPDGRYALVTGSRVSNKRGAYYLYALGQSNRTSGAIDLPYRINDLSFTGDGKYWLSACSDGFLRLMEVESGECLAQIRAHDGAVRAARLSPDGRYAVSTDSRGELRIWALDWELRQQAEPAWCAATARVFQLHAHVDNVRRLLARRWPIDPVPPEPRAKRGEREMQIVTRLSADLHNTSLRWLLYERPPYFNDCLAAFMSRKGQAGVWDVLGAFKRMTGKP